MTFYIWEPEIVGTMVVGYTLYSETTWLLEADKLALELQGYVTDAGGEIMVDYRA